MTATQTRTDHIAIFVPNWVGDAVMSTAALRLLRQHRPAARLFGVMRPHLTDVFAGLSLLDGVVVSDHRGGLRLGAALRCVRQLRRLRIDQAILLTNSLRTALLACAAGARRRVGTARDARRWLLTDPVLTAPRHVPTPAVEVYFRVVARALELPPQTPLPAVRLEAAVCESDRTRLNAFWQKQWPGLRERGVVCLNPGGAFGPAKHWPLEYFAVLARRLATECGKCVLVLCGPSERDQARRIVAQADHPAVVSIAEEPLGLGLTKAAIAEADLLITTDSGPRHFAAAFDVPVVTLFGPTHIRWSETGYARAVHLQKRVPCGPCQQRTCPEGHHRCMRELRVNEVFDAALRLLQAANRDKRGLGDRRPSAA